MIVRIVDWSRCVLIKTNLIIVSHVEIVTRVLNSQIKFHLAGIESAGQRVCARAWEWKKNLRLFMSLFESLLVSIPIKTIVLIEEASQLLIESAFSISFNENCIIRATIIKSFFCSSSPSENDYNIRLEIEPGDKGAERERASEKSQRALWLIKWIVKMQTIPCTKTMKSLYPTPIEDVVRSLSKIIAFHNDNVLPFGKIVFRFVQHPLLFHFILFFSTIHSVVRWSTCLIYSLLNFNSFHFVFLSLSRPSTSEKKNNILQTSSKNLIYPRYESMRMKLHNWIRKSRPTEADHRVSVDHRCHKYQVYHVHYCRTPTHLRANDCQHLALIRRTRMRWAHF